MMDDTLLPIVRELFSSVYILVVSVSAILLFGAFRWYLDPLRHIPGPFIARATPIWLWSLTWRGIECRTIAALHKKYGPVVRIAPSEVDVSDGSAINLIYVKNGGFMKSPTYRNFDLNGFPTIFSVLDPVHRAVRAKAVAPIFAHQAIAKGMPALQSVLEATMVELEQRKSIADGRPVDVLNLFRALSMDMVTLYLFGESFNGVGEERLSATPFIDSFVAGGRFFSLPGWIFHHVDYWAARLDKQKSLIDQSSTIVQDFAARMVDKSIVEERGEGKTYQGRLLGAGISREESIAQVVDVMFAGTDAAAMTLAKLCWYLGRFPDKYELARKEVLENSGADPQTLPYVSGIVKESLRLSMANPTRFARIVPSSGFDVPSLPGIPAGTSVGLMAFMLHSNPEVFPNPHEFVPERWLNPTPEMLRDSFYFGVGSRQCIARNFAAAGLWWTAASLIRSDVLKNAKPVSDKIEILEWFNAKVIDGKIEMVWQ